MDICDGVELSEGEEIVKRSSQDNGGKLKRNHISEMLAKSLGVRAAREQRLRHLSRSGAQDYEMEMQERRLQRAKEKFTEQCELADAPDLEAELYQELRAEEHRLNQQLEVIGSLETVRKKADLYDRLQKRL